jgi:hypothetical protein
MAVLAEMHALRPPPHREPNPNAPLWVAHQYVSKIATDVYARLTI